MQYRRGKYLLRLRVYNIEAPQIKGSYWTLSAAVHVGSLRQLSTAVLHIVNTRKKSWVETLAPRTGTAFNANWRSTQPRAFTTETAKNDPKLLAGTKLTYRRMCMHDVYGNGNAELGPTGPPQASQDTYENHPEFVHN